MISGAQLKASLPFDAKRELSEDIAAPKIASGKVREIYDLDENVLLVATDRISAFDVVLPGGIPGRGIILTQLSRFWFEKTKHIVPNHLVENQDAILSEQLKLGKDSQLRSMAAKKLKPLEIECVVRGYLAGSGWSSYQKTQSVCGISLPGGLDQAARLPEPIFTPTTKAVEGHDLPITSDEAAAIVGKELFEKAKAKSLELYAFGHAFAMERGIILADTKFEFGTDESGNLYLIDEVLTPDSSRYWDASEYRTGTSPASFDKQIIRDYLEGLDDWDKSPPGPTLPNETIARAQSRYLEVYTLLVG